MPDMASGYTQHSRTANITRQIPLSPGVESFVRQTLPEVGYLPVLRYLLERGAETSSAGEIAGVTREPKDKVQAALEHFERIGIARSGRSLLGRKYGLLRDGPRSDAAEKLIKLWDHPQTHRAVMAVVTRNAPKRT